jgi:hypothetical protein
MQKYQPITRTAARGPECTALIDEERDRLGISGLSLEAGEDRNQQLEWVLGHLGEKPTELERYLYLIGFCGQNERLFYKVLMSDRIRFLLTTNCRRTLHDIWVHSYGTYISILTKPASHATAASPVFRSTEMTLRAP